MNGKIVKWDADWYNEELTDTPCYLSLTERQVYLVGQIIEQISWDTRWVGDTSGMDLDAIAANLEYAISTCVEGSMSCEDIADCLDSPEAITVIQNLITSNQTIINSITQTVNNSGFGDVNHINVYITTIPDRNDAGFMQEVVKPLENCNLDGLWAGIRHGIVQLLNDNAKDLLEDLATIPNAAERLVVFFDVIPVMGDLAEGLAFQVNEIVPDLLALYESHESEAVLDEIACSLFDIVCSECRYPTFQEVFDAYKAGAIFLGLDINNMTLEDIANELLTLVANPASQAFNTISVWALWILNAQATFNGVSGTDAIIDWATLGEDSANNNWLQLCDGCNEPYRIWAWDFAAQGQGDFYLDPTPDGNISDEGVWSQGLGWRLTGGSGQRLEVAFPFNPAWEIRAIGLKTSGGTITARSLIRRPTLGSTTGGVATNLSNGTGDYNHCADGIASASGANEIAIAFQTATTTPATFFTKIAIVFNASAAPAESQPTTDNTICS